ncbi:MAG: class I adenylate-forming enzyme family protein [Betaproteobacteria bacterium]
MNVTDWIRDAARRTPDVEAICGDALVLTYGALDRTVDAIAVRLVAAGLGPGDAALVEVIGQDEILLLMLALGRIGVAAATPGYPKARAAARLMRARPDGTRAAKAIVVDDEWFRSPPPTASVPPVPSHQHGGAVASTHGSSGTTGAPKSMAVTHAMKIARIANAARVSPLPAGLRMLCAADRRAGYGYLAALRALAVGGTIVTARGLDDVAAAVVRHRVNVLTVAPVMLARILATLPESATLPTLVRVEVGGGYMPRPLYRQARARLCPDIHSVYGSTEGGYIATAPVAVLEAIDGAVGYVVPGVDAEVVAPDGTPLPPGAEGMLRARGPSFVREYIDDPAASVPVFHNGWVETGDVCSLAADGLLIVYGRSGEMFSAGGVKIVPQDVEDVLLSLDWIRDAAVFGAPDEHGLTQAWAAIVVDGKPDPAALDALCARQLRQRTPRSMLMVDAIPRNANGKIVRGELIAMAARYGKGTGR